MARICEGEITRRRLDPDLSSNSNIFRRKTTLSYSHPSGSSQTKWNCN